jgi:hypothetical protein
VGTQGVFHAQGGGWQAASNLPFFVLYLQRHAIVVRRCFARRENMMHRFSGWLLLALAQGVLAAPQLLQGRVGQAAVVMELDIAQDGQVEGRYFYRKHHRDLALSGKQQADGSLQLGENLQYDEQRNDITLRPQGSGWVGEWHGPKASKAVLSA